MCEGCLFTNLHANLTAGWPCTLQFPRFMGAILSIGTASPKFAHTQRHISAFMAGHVPEGGREKLIVRALHAGSAIDTRYSVLPDFSEPTHPQAMFPLAGSGAPQPVVAERLKRFNAEAPALALHASEQAIARAEAHIPDIRSRITHVISMSCTGLSAPGLDIDVVLGLGLPLSTFRTSVNFMGCYAAFHAMKLADALCTANPEAVVLIAGVELCTLHFQTTLSMDQLMANSLFADGAASMLMCHESVAESHLAPALWVRAFGSLLAPQGRGDMAWHVGANGFEMVLSSYIPELIERGMGPLIADMFSSLQIEREDVTHWGIHPGGKKILEACAHALGIGQEALAPSFDILRNFGNMSSVTVLYTLQKLMDEHIRFDRYETVFAAGFGPGLTMEAAVFETVNVPAPAYARHTTHSTRHNPFH